MRIPTDCYFSAGRHIKRAAGRRRLEVWEPDVARRLTPSDLEVSPPFSIICAQRLGGTFSLVRDTGDLATL